MWKWFAYTLYESVLNVWRKIVPSFIANAIISLVKIILNKWWFPEKTHPKVNNREREKKPSRLLSGSNTMYDLNHTKSFYKIIYFNKMKEFLNLEFQLARNLNLFVPWMRSRAIKTQTNWNMIFRTILNLHAWLHIT